MPNPYSVHLYGKTAGKSDANAKIWINNGVYRELRWFVNHIGNLDGVRLLESEEWSLGDAVLACDACLNRMGFWTSLDGRSQGFVHRADDVECSKPGAC